MARVLKSIYFWAVLVLVIGVGAFAIQRMDHGTHAVPVAEIGTLQIFAPMIRATPPNAGAAGGFLKVKNTGDADDRLVAAQMSADIAGLVQLHEMAMDGDVMRMPEVEGGVDLPAGETIILAPGGLHIMVMQLQRPMVTGDSHAITLTFAKAGELVLPFSVMDLDDIKKQLGDGNHEGIHH